MNILDQVLSELQELKSLIAQRPDIIVQAPEIISSEELMKRFEISEPTLINWRKKKIIPFIQANGIIRYNWPKVVEALENKKKK